MHLKNFGWIFSNIKNFYTQTKIGPTTIVVKLLSPKSWCYVSRLISGLWDSFFKFFWWYESHVVAHVSWKSSWTVQNWLLLTYRGGGEIRVLFCHFEGKIRFSRFLKNGQFKRPFWKTIILGKSLAHKKFHKILSFLSYFALEIRFLAVFHNLLGKCKLSVFEKTQKSFCSVNRQNQL